MKKNLIIASFNVQNPYMKKNGDLEREMQELASLIFQENIDILCCQEMLEESVLKLSSFLKDYFIVGESRYGNHIFSKNISLLKKFNEYTPVFSKAKILSSVHHKLPWFPKRIKDINQSIFKYHSLTPRILTEAFIELDSSYTIRVFNTHLDKRILGVQRRQLNFILQLAKTSYPLILMGDFNIQLDCTVFQNFIKEIENLGLKRVSIDTKTLQYAKNKYPIDHIFIPSDWKVLECKTVDNSISDHYLLLVKVEILI